MNLQLSVLSTLIFLFLSCRSTMHNEIGNTQVDSIKLLVADSSVFQHWEEEQYTGKVIPIPEYNVGFVDSNGQATHRPMLVISFGKKESQKLLSLFDSLANQPHNNPTGGINYYKHVFQCYSKGTIIKQVSLSSETATLYIEPDRKQYHFDSEDLSIYKRLLSTIKGKGAYLYNDDVFFGVK